MKIHGIDGYYVPRTSEATLNNLLGEQPDTRLTEAYPVEFYLVKYDGYEGPSEVKTTFGFEFHASTDIVITARSFRRHVAQASQETIQRPRTGDLIYIPVLAKLFEIKNVDDDIAFHQLGRKAGKTMYYQIRTELFKYSQENIQTGIADIDTIETLNSYTQSLYMNTVSGIGNYVIGEEVYQGANYLVNTVSAKVTDWNPTNKVLNVIDIRGQFNVASNVIGTQSFTSYTLSSFDGKEDHVPDDSSDNYEVANAAVVIIDTSETNPLG